MIWPRLAAGFGEQDRHGGPRLRNVERTRLTAEQGLQRGKASDLHVLGDLDRSAPHRVAGPAAVSEGIGRGEIHQFDEPHRVVEIGIAFTGKANNEVR